jgi:hypothetical protein
MLCARGSMTKINTNCLSNYVAGGSRVFWKGRSRGAQVWNFAASLARGGSPIADSSLDGSEHYEHGIRKIASGEIKPDLICNAQWRETFDLKL